jgi:SAM-dependent MidA family methyltransferase
VTTSPAWREAWQAALYGPDGFFVTHRPADHFRTSVTAGPLLAEAVLALLRRERLTTVVDLGAGGGELITALHALDPDLSLVGVDLAARPPGLPDAVGWRHKLPGRIEGLLIAHEWLDDVPCDVVEVDDRGTVRLVHVDPATGVETLGAEHADPWLDAWWPLTHPGERAEVGAARDAAWADAVRRVDGLAVAVDYGHTRDDRPPSGSLRAYAAGRQVDVVPDGSRDVTADVAVDAVAAPTGATLLRQRDALARLGIDGTRPSLDLARSDPAAYVRLLGRAGAAAELTARGGLGDFWWIVVDTREPPRRHGTLDA